MMSFRRGSSLRTDEAAVGALYVASPSSPALPDSDRMPGRACRLRNNKRLPGCLASDRGGVQTGVSGRHDRSAGRRRHRWAAAERRATFSARIAAGRWFHRSAAEPLFAPLWCRRATAISVDRSGLSRALSQFALAPHAHVRTACSESARVEVLSPPAESPSIAAREKDGRMNLKVEVRRLWESETFLTARPMGKAPR
jgi:hypothetical protein